MANLFKIYFMHAVLVFSYISSAMQAQVWVTCMLVQTICGYKCGLVYFDHPNSVFECDELEPERSCEEVGLAG